MAGSYASGTSDVPLLGETIGENLERTVARVPDREALVVRHQGVRLTYAQLDAQVDRLARALMAAGLDVGDRLGIWSPNCAEWVLVQYATAKAGIVLVNVNPAYRTSELEYALRQSGCRVLVAAKAFKTSDYAAMVQEVRPRLPGLERVVLLDTPDWDELLAQADAVDEDALRGRTGGLQFDDPINIQYTSGTTGSPKGATLTHHNILNNGYFVARGCRYTEEDRVCIPVPFYHCFGMVMGNLGCTSHGAAMVVPAPAFDPGATLAAVQEERCTSLYGVPTMFIAELDHPDFDRFDLSSLRTGIMAGSPCPVEVMRQVIDRMHMTDVTICYGMTETSPVSTQTAADDELERRVSTVGRVHPHVEVKIVDPLTGELVPHGTPGELLTPRLLGHARLLGRPAAHGGGDRRRALDAHGRPRHDGRPGLRGHRRPLEGHGHPRRGERVPARGRGVPLRASGGGRRRRLRGARPALRGGAHGLDPPARGGERDGGGDPRVLPRAHRALQGPALRALRRRVPMTVTGKVQKFRMREAAIAELGLGQDAVTA